MSIKSHLKKLGVSTTLATAAVVTFSPSTSEALTQNLTAAVTILTPLTVTEDTKMNFGIVERPPTSDTFVLDLADGITGSDSSLIVASGTPLSGDYTIKGDNTNTIQISTPTDSANVTGLTLSAFTANYNAGAYTFGNSAVAPTTTGKALILGATLTITSAAATGTLNPGFDLTVLYE